MSTANIFIHNYTGGPVKFKKKKNKKKKENPLRMETVKYNYFYLQMIIVCTKILKDSTKKL